jgi:hypothetical protein
VDGHKTDYLRNYRHEADRASRLLTDACGFPVFVKAALVFLTGTLIPDVTIKQAPEDIAVLDGMDIPRGVPPDERQAHRRAGDRHLRAKLGARLPGCDLHPRLASTRVASVRKRSARRPPTFNLCQRLPTMSAQVSGL